MAFRIPKRQSPKLMTLPETLNHALRGFYDPSKDPASNLTAALRRARLHIEKRGPRPSMFSCDPIEVAEAILDGIKSGALTLRDIKPLFRDRLREPFKPDWRSGHIHVPTRGEPVALRPMFALDEVDALFTALEPSASPVIDSPSDPLSSVPADAEPHVRGRRPKVMTRLVSEMSDAAAQGFDLAGATEKVLEHCFKASRDSCRKARTKVLAKIVGNSSAILSANDK